MQKKTPKGKGAWSVTVGEKGQIVIPRAAREMFGIQPGDTLLLLGDERRGLAIPPQNMLSALAERIFDGDMPADDKEDAT